MPTVFCVCIHGEGYGKTEDKHSVPFFHLLVPEIELRLWAETQVISLGSKHLHLQSHLVGPYIWNIDQ